MAPGRVTFHVDGVQAWTVDQAPGYPMQLMLGIYDLTSFPRSEASPQNRLVIDSFRAYRAPRRMV